MIGAGVSFERSGNVASADEAKVIFTRLFHRLGGVPFQRAYLPSGKPREPYFETRLSCSVPRIFFCCDFNASSLKCAITALHHSTHSRMQNWPPYRPRVSLIALVRGGSAPASAPAYARQFKSTLGCIRMQLFPQKGDHVGISLWTRARKQELWMMVERLCRIRRGTCGNKL